MPDSTTPAPADPHVVFERLADILGCKWTLAILDGIARGINRPGRLERELPGLTTKVMNERLAKLTRYGVIVRHAYDETPPRVEYDFSAEGRRMLELLRQVRQFAEQWSAPRSPAARADPTAAVPGVPPSPGERAGVSP